MSLVVFDALIQGINCVLGLAGELSKAEERRRERVAAWLQELGELIQDIADKIELNDFPHNTCAQMEIMVDHFPLIVDDLIHPKKLQKTTEMLKVCTQLDQLFGEATAVKKKQRDKMIVQLLHVSGQLQGLASVIKYME